MVTLQGTSAPSPRTATGTNSRGGPGTGKSVISLNLMADLLLEGYNAQYATGSKAFTETLREIIGARGGVQFKYFNSYQSAEANVVDVLICDESHRIRINSHSRFTPKAEQTNAPQVVELLEAAKVAVFFVGLFRNRSGFNSLAGCETQSCTQRFSV